GVKHGERPLAMPAEIKSREERGASLKETIASTEKAISRLESEAGESPTESQRQEREAAQASLKTARAALAALPALPVSYAGTGVQPAPTRFLRRGDVRSPEPVVAPAALSAVVDLPSDFELGPEAPEAQRRLKFALWLS